ncbi:MAG: macro domain-containing protein [bacterium]
MNKKFLPILLFLLAIPLIQQVFAANYFIAINLDPKKFTEINTTLKKLGTYAPYSHPHITIVPLGQQDETALITAFEKSKKTLDPLQALKLNPGLKCMGQNNVFAFMLDDASKMYMTKVFEKVRDTLTSAGIQNTLTYANYLPHASVGYNSYKFDESNFAQVAPPPDYQTGFSDYTIAIFRVGGKGQYTPIAQITYGDLPKTEKKEEKKTDELTANNDKTEFKSGDHPIFLVDYKKEQQKITAAKITYWGEQLGYDYKINEIPVEDGTVYKLTQDSPLKWRLKKDETTLCTITNDNKNQYNFSSKQHADLEFVIKKIFEEIYSKAAGAPTDTDLNPKIASLKIALETLKKKLGDLATTLKDVAAKLGTEKKTQNQGPIITLVFGNLVQQSFQDPGHSAIVNAANPQLGGGGGITGAIWKASGGLDNLTKPILQKLGKNALETGEAVISGSNKLKTNKIVDWVIHTPGPHGTDAGREQLLKNSYLNCLKVADENNIQTVAFPAISIGIYGYPFDEAKNIAIKTVIEYLTLNKTITKIKEVRFVMASPNLDENGEIISANPWSFDKYSAAINPQNLKPIDQLDAIYQKLKASTFNANISTDKKERLPLAFQLN